MVSIQFRKIFTDPPFSGGWTKKLKTFSGHFLCRAGFKISIFMCFFILKKEPPKKNFIFLKGRYFVMGGPIDINVDVF